MTALTLTLIKLAFLAVLWLFVLTAVGVIRTDLFGERKPAKPTNLPPQAQSKKQQQKRQRQEEKQRKQQAKLKPVSRDVPQKVVITSGPRSGTSHTLEETPVTIGRANDTTLALGDDYASGRHARLFPQDGQWLVEDLGSTNGTYLDRSKVSKPTPVSCGVPIRIGKTTLELRR